MKKLLLVAGALAAIIFAHFTFDANAQGVNFWYPQGSNLTPVSSAWGVSSTQFCLSGSCITVWPSGSGSSTVLHGISPIIVSALSNGNQTSSCPTCTVNGLTGNGTSTYVAVYKSAGTLVGYAGLSFDGTSTLSVGGTGTSTISGDNNTPSQFPSGLESKNGNIQLDTIGSTISFGSPPSGFLVYGASTDTLGLKDNSNSNEADLYFGNVPSPQTFTFPNASGTFALLENVLGTGNVTTTHTSTTVTVSFTGILPAANGGTATTTALGSCAFLNTCGSGPATTTINASGTTLTGPSFTFASTTTILPYASGTALYWKFASLAISQFTNDSSYATTGALSAYQPLLSFPLAYGSTTHLGAGTDISISSQNINFVNPGYVTAASSVTWTAAITHTATTTFASTTVLSGTVSSTEASALILAGSNGVWGSYGGASACSAGQAVTTISATGATTCAAFLTSAPATTTFNGVQSATFNYNVVASGGATTSVATSGGNTTTTITVDAGAYLGISANQLTVSSTLASSSVSFNFYTPTTTTGYNLSYIVSANQKKITYVDCADQTATSTVSLYYATSSANAAQNKPATTTLASLVCGAAGNSTTSFNQAILPAGDYLMANVTSTSGTPTHTTVNVEATVQ